MERISIVGFGRFGETLYDIVKKDFFVTLYDIKKEVFHGVRLTPHTRIAASLTDVYESGTVFFAVPIAAFENVLAEHTPYITDQLLIDVLSVKVYPEKIFKKHLKRSHARFILTHPMFGPYSVHGENVHLPFVVHRGTATKKEYTHWKEYFAKKGFRVIELSAREHDELAAKSQGVTHFVGRMLEEYGFIRTPIDTVGASKLHEVEGQTCGDTWELFVNLQNYNPYTKHMRIALGRAFDALYGKLLPPRAKAGTMTIGIQGGVGSFNHEAVLDYIKRHDIKNAAIQYLFTTEKVMRSLHRGDIDFGLFAIHNSIGGIVDESIKAIARYKFSIVEEFAIPVRHVLMARSDSASNMLTGVMAHPQALKQCNTTLALRHPKLILKSGTGDYIDTARVAKALAEGKFPKTTAILGPKGLADRYGFKIVDEDLQDQKNNTTSFLMVKRL